MSPLEKRNPNMHAYLVVILIGNNGTNNGVVKFNLDDPQRHPIAALATRELQKVLAPELSIAWSDHVCTPIKQTSTADAMQHILCIGID